MKSRLLLILIQFVFLISPAGAQTIAGTIEDLDDHARIKDVSVVNVFSNEAMLSDSSGHFRIKAIGGQVVEMRKPGYKTVRVRIPNGSIPPFFRIMMYRTSVLTDDIYAYSNLSEYQKDSIKTRKTYASVLAFPKLEGLDVIQHPFSAMSKKNRQKWEFQDSYAAFEQEKYVDYTFSPKLINSITGLSGDSLSFYMRRYRPSYERLRAMKEYEYYNYIKRTVEFYRRTGGRSGGQRSSG